MWTPARRSRAVLSIVLIACAFLVPLAAPAIVAIDLVVLSTVLPDTPVTIVRSVALHCDEQPVALLSLVSFRAPPATSPRA
jgi:hypothetical protein